MNTHESAFDASTSTSDGRGASDAPARPPGARQMLPALLIAPIVSGALFGITSARWSAVETAAACGAAGTVAVGWPMLYWALDHGRTRLRHMLIVGSIAGAVPLLVALGSGVLGLFIKSRGSFEYVEWALSHGASIPYYGVYGWSRFFAAEALAIIAGTVSGAVYYLYLSYPAANRRG